MDNNNIIEFISLEKYRSYETIFNQYKTICELYEFDGTMKDLYNALITVNDDFDFWKSAIIDHYNSQKARDNKTNNPYNRFYYYGFAQREIKYLEYIFAYISEIEYMNYIHYYLSRPII